MRSFLEQFERVKRFLKRIEDQGRNSTAYDDDLWAFFQNCYHFKDWIKNDPNINLERQTVETYVDNNEDLKICADLANRSKHLKLKLERIREDADITNRGVTIYVPCTGTGEVGTSTCEHTITLGDGRKRIALDVAKKAVDAWKDFLVNNGLVKS